MKLITKPSTLTHWRRQVLSSVSIGFIPTMGALHLGHLSLVERAKKENDLTVVSIFVNPTQFGPQEDFKKYPRPWKKDLKLLEMSDIQILFAPSPKSMYPPNYSTRVSVSGLTSTLCGAQTSRGPEHFDGVASVVAKLFNLIRPHRAYFGLKDYQQVRVIEQMTKDLNFDTQIVRCPTMREKDGLAMSSRNTFLSQEERALAPRLHQALRKGGKLLRSRRFIDPRLVLQTVKANLSAIPNSKIDYVDMVDPTFLKRVRKFDRPVLLAAAIFLGKTRLIDNILIN